MLDTGRICGPAVAKYGKMTSSLGNSTRSASELGGRKYCGFRRSLELSLGNTRRAPTVSATCVCASRRAFCHPPANSGPRAQHPKKGESHHGLSPFASATVVFSNEPSLNLPGHRAAMGKLHVEVALPPRGGPKLAGTASVGGREGIVDTRRRATMFSEHHSDLRVDFGSSRIYIVVERCYSPASCQARGRVRALERTGIVLSACSRAGLGLVRPVSNRAHRARQRHTVPALRKNGGRPGRERDRWLGVA